MKRTYIPNEYNINDDYGTNISKENKNIFGSTLINIPNQLDIIDDINIYYQSLKNEQLDFKKESLSTPIIFDSNITKKTNSNIYIKNGYLHIDINYKKLYIDYIFSILKKNRVFENITNDICSKKTVDNFIIDYINDNIIYKYSKFDLTLYLNIIDISGENIIFSPDIRNKNNIIKSYLLDFDNQFFKIKYPINIDFNIKTLLYYYDISAKK